MAAIAKYGVRGADTVKKRLPGCKQNDIYTAIWENGIKDDLEYSAYNFRSKKNEDQYKLTGILPNGTPSIYKPKTIDFLTQILKNEK